jgi:type IV pilus assembly protein PilA
MICSRCGGTIADQSQFCSRCGASLSDSAPGFTPPVQPGPLPGAATDGKAVASLVLGILSVTILSFLAGIPAVILGHLSRSSIRQSMGRLKGDGMALAGLVMGYISVAAIPIILIMAAIAIPNLLRARMNANSANAFATVRTLITNEIVYSTTYPTNGYAPDLATLGPGSNASCPDQGNSKNACLIDSVLGNPSCTGASWCVKGAYQYNIQSPERAAPFTDFVISAVPVNAAAASRAFCASSDAVVRSEELTRPRSHPYSQRECAALLPQ